MTIEAEDPPAGATSAAIDRAVAAEHQSFSATFTLLTSICLLRCLRALSLASFKEIQNLPIRMDSIPRRLVGDPSTP